MLKMLSQQPAFDRKKLTLEAMKASIKARKAAGVNLMHPINVYDACDDHKIIVRFNDISMEGMYDRHPKPRIHISALRPLVRRNITCAHELGHHVFNHGSTIDELNDRSEVADHNDPIEFIANQFAYFFMMPTLGVRNAFAYRNIDLNSVTEKDLFKIACSFGVGYSTLLTHLRYGLGMLPDMQFQKHRRATPKQIRTEIIEDNVEEPLVIVDKYWSSPTLDLETGDYVLFPSKIAPTPTQLCYEGEVADGSVYRAASAGIGRIDVVELQSGLFVRVAKRSIINGKTVGYIGLARYRHMEDDDDT